MAWLGSVGGGGQFQADSNAFDKKNSNVSFLERVEREEIFPYISGAGAPIEVVGHEFLALLQRVLLLQILSHGRGCFVESREDERGRLGQFELVVHFNIRISIMPIAFVQPKFGEILGVGFVRHDEAVEAVGLEELLVHLLQKCLFTVMR